jgi:preprotein translocase subunit Sec61beta
VKHLQKNQIKGGNQKAARAGMLRGEEEEEGRKSGGEES